MSARRIKKLVEETTCELRVHSGRLSEEEIQRLVDEAEANQEADAGVLETIEARQSLSRYIESVRNSVLRQGSSTKGNDASGLALNDEDRATVQEAIDDAEAWILGEGANPETTADDVNTKKRELEEVCSPIIQHAYGNGATGTTESEDDTEEDAHDEL